MTWTHPYSRETAAFPAPWLHDHKFWPCVSRIDNVYGDRNPSAPVPDRPCSSAHNEAVHRRTKHRPAQHFP
jgi:hypothetical protein